LTEVSLTKKGGESGGSTRGLILSRLNVIGSGILKGFLFLGVITVVSISFLALYHLYELKRKMEAHPWIRAVKLERRFPHTLEIEVERQVPAALARMDDFYYVNRWGEMFKKVSETDDTDLPVITGLSADASEVQKELNQAMHVVKVLESEEGDWSVSQLSEIHVSKDGAMSLYFNHMKAEVTFMWNELADKMDGLKKVAGHLNESGKTEMVTRINLNYVDGAVVSFKNS